MSDTQPCQQAVLLAQKNGLHLTPISAVVKAASPFDCDIRIAWNQKEANAKSVMELMTLGATCGSELQVTAVGKDAEDALQAVAAVLSREQ